VDPYLVDLAQRVDNLGDPREVEQAMDKLEFLYEVLDPDQQEAAAVLLERLTRRLELLRSPR